MGGGVGELRRTLFSVKTWLGEGPCARPSPFCIFCTLIINWWKKKPEQLISVLGVVVVVTRSLWHPLTVFTLKPTEGSPKSRRFPVIGAPFLFITGGGGGTGGAPRRPLTRGGG